MKPEQFTKEKGGVVNIHIEPNDDVYIRQDDVYSLMQEYADKQLLIQRVSQQRELLDAYDKFAEMEHSWFIGTEKETKDKFLAASNCG